MYMNIFLILQKMENEKWKINTGKHDKSQIMKILSKLASPTSML